MFLGEYEIRNLFFRFQDYIYQLVQLTDIINLASTRGAFKGNELSHIGTLYDTLTVGIDKAISIAKKDLEKVEIKVDDQ